MHPNMRFLKTEPGKHAVVITNFWIGKFQHAEIVGAFSGTGRGRPNGSAELRQAALQLSWTFCDVCIHFIGFASCHGRVLFLIVACCSL